MIIIPNIIWKNKKYSKPPASLLLTFVLVLVLVFGHRSHRRSNRLIDKQIFWQNSMVKPQGAIYSHFPKNHTMWAPPVINWFINPMNYSY